MDFSWEGGPGPAAGKEGQEEKGWWGASSKQTLGFCLSVAAMEEDGTGGGEGQTGGGTLFQAEELVPEEPGEGECEDSGKPEVLCCLVSGIKEKWV